MWHICDDGHRCSQLGVWSAGFNSWRGFSGCAHCANLNKGPHLSGRAAVFSLQPTTCLTNTCMQNKLLCLHWDLHPVGTDAT